MTKKTKKNMRTPNILTMSHRLEVTLRKYLRISACPISTFMAVSSTLESILTITSSCSLIMWASCWKIPPNSTMVDSMDCIVSARDSRYFSVTCKHHNNSYIITAFNFKSSIKKAALVFLYLILSL